MNKATKAELAQLPPDLRADIARKIKKERRVRKQTRWRGRAASLGQDWDSMSKQQRRVFKVAFRADRALQKLEGILVARDGNGGAPLAKAASTAGSERLTDVEIRERNAARAGRSL